ncbi:MAG: replication initiation protein [Clostridia bacterium]|nr:replication initiation protein [Clostridia bacterium]
MPKIELVVDDRSQLVLKSNEIIRQARYDMTAPQQKAYLFLISKIKPTDKADAVYEFQTSRFLKACGLTDAGVNYKAVLDILLTIGRVRFWVPIDGKLTLLGLINTVTVDTDNGTIYCTFHEQIQPYLLNLKKNYTIYELTNVLAMRSKYAIRFYEIAKSYQFVGSFSMTPEEIKEMLGAKYDEYRDIKRRVIKPSVEEINNLTDINLAFEETTENRKVLSVKFTVAVKDYNEQWLAEKERDRIYGKNT